MLDRINIKYALAWFTWLTCTPANQQTHTRTLTPWSVFTVRTFVCYSYFFRFFNALPQQSPHRTAPSLSPLFTYLSLFFYSLPLLCPSLPLAQPQSVGHVAPQCVKFLQLNLLCLALFVCVVACVCVLGLICMRKCLCWVNLNLIEKHVTQRQQTASTRRTPPYSALQLVFFSPGVASFWRSLALTTSTTTSVSRSASCILPLGSCASLSGFPAMSSAV